MKKSLNVPKFKNKEEEQEFWEKIDLSEYFEADDFVSVNFPNLKPSTKTISIRLPEGLLQDIKMMANKRDVPYQSLIKIILSDRVRDEDERRYKK